MCHRFATVLSDHRQSRRVDWKAVVPMLDCRRSRGISRIGEGVMYAIRLATLSLGACLALLQPAAADFKLALDEQTGTTQGWKIGVNQTLAGCLAVATYRDDTTVWFGLGKDIGPY